MSTATSKISPGDSTYEFALWLAYLIMQPRSTPRSERE